MSGSFVLACIDIAAVACGVSTWYERVYKPRAIAALQLNQLAHAVREHQAYVERSHARWVAKQREIVEQWEAALLAQSTPVPTVLPTVEQSALRNEVILALRSMGSSKDQAVQMVARCTGNYLTFEELFKAAMVPAPRGTK